MNIAEAHRLKALEAEVASLKRQLADVVRRLDEPKAEKEDTTLRLKKSG
jgi:hypothetical protein